MAKRPKIFNLRMTDEELKLLKMEALNRNVTASNLMRMALKYFMEYYSK
ncbi:MAG: hypothetical protein R3230_01370 [Nitrosopumilaceae archaeon]|nr:hypothetical protein [Nitrosopumilaceae archaeon]